MRETWETEMQGKTNGCARSEELVAYLYGETARAETKEFENHLARCASCRTEVSAFGDVREAIGQWRQQSLGAFAAPAVEANDVTAYASPRETIRPRRSAFAALREFFTLSPVWMRAATVAVALVFCALVVIAIAHFREPAKTEVAANPTSVKPQENRAIQENKSEVAVNQPSSPDTTANQNPPSTSPQKETVVQSNQPPAPKQIKHSGLGSQQLVKRQRNQFLPRNNNDPSETLAENDYLPFTTPRNEEKLPSLADLGDEPE